MISAKNKPIVIFSGLFVSFKGHWKVTSSNFGLFLTPCSSLNLFLVQRHINLDPLQPQIIYRWLLSASWKMKEDSLSTNYFIKCISKIHKQSTCLQKVKTVRACQIFGKFSFQRFDYSWIGNGCSKEEFIWHEDLKWKRMVIEILEQFFLCHRVGVKVGVGVLVRTGKGRQKKCHVLFERPQMIS